MNKWITAVMIAAVFALQAKQMEKPDANTLWLEDGKDIAVEKKPNFRHWMPGAGKRALDIKPKADGKGFTLFAQDSNGRYTVTRIKISPEYPYLTFRITGLEVLKGYCDWRFTVEKMMTIVQTATPQKGIYVCDLFRNLPETESGRKAAYFYIYLHNLRMDLEYIELVKKPAVLVRAECADPEIKPGSKVKFIAELPNKAEEVSISLIDGRALRPVPVNDAAKIQLKPADETKTTWIAELELKSIGIQNTVSRHGLFMKMEVQGGNLNEPVWASLPYPAAP